MFELNLESQVLMIEDPESRSSCENIFVFRKNNVVQSHSRSEIRTVDQCLRVRCSVTVRIDPLNARLHPRKLWESSLDA